MVLKIMKAPELGAFIKLSFIFFRVEKY